MTTRLLQILLGVHLFGALPSLLCAVLRTGDYVALFAPSLARLGDPKDSIPFPSVEAAPWWCPLYAWFVTAHFLVGFLLFFPLPLVGWSVAMSARDRGPSVHARAWVWAWGAVTVLTFSPWGFALHYWMAD
ncbi:hypothetical protein ACWT_2531 [Actinoplanes sp. SE50]|uniref:hypothetical protein n=1 Tax=unclassified Actinoplanes TaxID=2626549 RepID=UPI00023ED411|nr:MULTISPECIES: hypothetical protein [unclassified Actinoplanes]AEV83910.1 hypothetical protein ACPL_3015 [Actinoplanes sp. SE50/110]ATO81946.1 hypothetical protein ACWT_2531 [Actinoplanes sp. SE50]SLL99354.1 hypothetical protein ACSP50_2585 [Actinoplanes sp. SE50/110]